MNYILCFNDCVPNLAIRQVCQFTSKQLIYIKVKKSCSLILMLEFTINVLLPAISFNKKYFFF